jgi:hypothetical protein
MSEPFLEEQLKRIKEMNEQMTRLRDRATEMSAAFERGHAATRYGPLHEVRDFRSTSSVPERDRADDARRQPARRSSRARQK